MAFHVACPITCRRICYCTLGFPRDLQGAKGKTGFLDEVSRIEEFLRDPWGIRALREGTVQVSVPKVEPVVVPAAAPIGVLNGAAGGGDAAEEAASAQHKRVALQRKAAATMVAAEDYARRFEAGDIAVASKDAAVDEQSHSSINVMCRICFLGETEGSERAKKMLSCKSCGKKYHRSCLKAWAQNRDLFHWSSWSCPSCRICEVCRRTGDPNKFVFCKRCDGAYHCYCQHPPHKNVSSGPYLCPKHTRCHSCGSNVPGNGLSVRWFLGYTCCDACGRLFVKGNYCPVCLKVYRDSESTPMVCCDVCQRWVHCHCDGISDEKYLQFQVDGNLQYKCSTCRGECYQVKDLEDAVQELWRRRDIADRDLTASLRASAGLPTQEEIFSISPYSDDEDNGPDLLKNEFGRSIKVSLKGLVDKSPKKNKEFGKKSSKMSAKRKGYEESLVSKMEPRQRFGGQNDTHSFRHSMGDDKNNNVQSHQSRSDVRSSPIAGMASRSEGICINQPVVLKQKFVNEVMVNDEDRTSRIVKIKSNKPLSTDTEDDAGRLDGELKTVKKKKLVINLGPRKINVTNSPRSDASSCQREQDLVIANDSEDTGRQRMNEKFLVDRDEGTTKFGNGDKIDYSGQVKGLKFSGREGNLIKFGKLRSEGSDLNPKSGRGIADGCEANSSEHTHTSSAKRSIEGSRVAVVPAAESATLRSDKAFTGKQYERRPERHVESNDGRGDTTVSHALPKDPKPLLRFKFKKPNLENQNSWTSNPEEEKSLIKGQRSKRKRPSCSVDKACVNVDEDVQQLHPGSLMEEMMDANWILKKLGRDAIGKRVEVNQPSDNSWHKGTVTDSNEGTSISVTLDDGRVKTLELGKQGVRFVPQKQKRSKA
ncbi:uncharacterized protein LOC120015181 [Tripterygium wilfordii]|nr:uncharacterized protein LOC120015181 [Tripterygium wilfordii]